MDGTLSVSSFLLCFFVFLTRLRGISVVLFVCVFFFSLRLSALQHLVSQSALVFLTSAAGPPVAAAASLAPYADGAGRKYPPRKYPLPKRESSLSLESASVLNGQLSNGNGQKLTILTLCVVAYLC